MRLVSLHPDEIQVAADLSRSRSSKQFEERLRSSIDEIGLAEPLKVVPLPDGGYLVVDGNLRLRAVRAIREKSPDRFASVEVFVLDYDKRFELRYQSDIYQDLLPSQLATLVEHLHAREGILKVDIARFIGVSPATLRNYTGLARLMSQGGLPARIVDLMDAGVVPASNPFAWLRLRATGMRRVIEDYLSAGSPAEEWIDQTISRARQGTVQRLPLKYVEQITGALPGQYYRGDEKLRSVKRDLGLRKSSSAPGCADVPAVTGHLLRVEATSKEPVLVGAAKALREYFE